MSKYTIHQVLIGLFISMSFAHSVQATEELQAIYLSDMTLCEPAEKLSTTLQPDKWRLIPYGTNIVSGTLLGAASFVEAEEVRLPIQQKGWYQVSLGIWNPHHM